MRRKFTYIVQMTDAGILFRYSEDFLICQPLVKHAHDTNDTCRHQAQWLDRDQREDHDIQWIHILTQGLRDKSIIGGIIHRRVKDAVQFEQAGFFIYLILSTHACGDFNYSIYELRYVTSNGCFVPGVLDHGLKVTKKVRSCSLQTQGIVP